jgi:IS30 family transposase
MTNSRGYQQLDIQERVHLQFRLEEGWNRTTIAKEMGRHHSSVIAEIDRNGGEEHYNAWKAEHRSKKSKRINARMLDQDEVLARALLGYLEDHRSPRQALVLLNRRRPSWRLPSPETIYQWMYASKTELARLALKTLTRRRKHRRNRRRAGDTRGSIPKMVTIDQRPFGPDDRSVFGHWEGDLIIGKQNRSAVLTLEERKTRYTKVIRVANRNADTVARAIKRFIRQLPNGAMLSITWDRGKELALHQEITKATGVPIYFCDAHSPWQRGSNENTNGVLRRKLPKGTDLSWVTARDARRITRWVNRRPMKILFWGTPEEAYARELRGLHP